jgi:hypothetical protein
MAMRRCTLVIVALLSGCVSPAPPARRIDPDVARAEISRLLPAGTVNRDAWAFDIFTAFEHLGIEPTREHTCAVVAVAQQESSFQANPTVPGLPAIAWREIDSRAEKHDIPKLAVHAALQLQSPTGKSYSERLDHATTEKDLSDIFEDFIGMVPLGKKLFADWNPVRTAGPMQVSVAFAEKHASEKPYPYPVTDTIRHEVFTRRGGLYFGIAHLLDYPADYDDMVYRFADYNAGHYSSRNAAFQNALSIAAKTPLALDGDVVRYGDDDPSKTELAARKIASKLNMSERDIHRDLERGETPDFANTKLYERVFAIAEKQRGTPLPRALVPRIKLESAKITRSLTTEWFARRVNERYGRCLAQR